MVSNWKLWLWNTYPWLSVPDSLRVNMVSIVRSGGRLSREAEAKQVLRADR